MYLLVECDVIVAVVDDLKDYLTKFEPVDVVDGRMYAFNQEGRKFIFTGGGIKREPWYKALFSVVDIGTWRSGEPYILEQAGNHIAEARTLIDITKTGLLGERALSSKDKRLLKDLDNFKIIH